MTPRSQQRKQAAVQQVTARTAKITTKVQPLHFIISLAHKITPTHQQRKQVTQQVAARLGQILKETRHTMHRYQERKQQEHLIVVPVVKIPSTV